jgi:hypothetical protein
MLNRLSKAHYSARSAIFGGVWVMLAGNLPYTSAATDKSTPPLIENLRELHCAADEKAARTALSRLGNNIHPSTGLPDEQESIDNQKSNVNAGTVDLAINTILETVSTYPSLTALSESVLFSWNYCDVHHNGIYYDLKIEDSEIQRTPSAYQSPADWHGFGQIGLGNANIPRYQPAAFRNTARTARDKLLYNWWNLQRNQCLPHPANGQVFYRQQYIARARVNTDNSLHSARYPHDWRHQCDVPVTLSHLPESTQQQSKKPEITPYQPNPLRIIHALREWQSAGAPPAILPEQSSNSADSAEGKPHKSNTTPNHMTSLAATNTATLVAPVESERAASTGITTHIDLARQNGPVPGLAPPAIRHPIKLTAAERAKNESDLTRRFDLYARELRGLSVEPVLQNSDTGKKSPKVQREPLLATALPGTPTNVPYQNLAAPFDSIQDKKARERVYHALNGSFALSNRSLEDNNWSLTTNFSYKPLVNDFYFLRSGFTVTEGDEPVSYYWGIGYNDWHPGTWAFELNNWGPLKPGDGLSIENAIASISYKFDSTLLRRYKLNASATISGGKTSSPAFTFAGSWSPKPNWFIRHLITQPLEGGDTTWAYGFGYNDWRSQTWSLEYNNWGPNTLSAPNFRENALITLSWKWNL